MIASWAMLVSCLSSVPQEDYKCILDANGLLSETFCTSNFCLAKGDSEVLEGERLYLVVQGRPVCVWGKKCPWHNRVTDLAGSFATWRNTWFRLWQQHGMKMPVDFDLKFSFIHHLFSPSCLLHYCTLFQLGCILIHKFHVTSLSPILLQSSARARHMNYSQIL
jgi:hypothetical protein